MLRLVPGKQAPSIHDGVPVAGASDHLVAEGFFAARQAVKVLQQDVDDIVLVVAGLAARMRGDEGVGRLTQRRRGGKRLLRRDVGKPYPETLRFPRSTPSPPYLVHLRPRQSGETTNDPLPAHVEPSG